MYGIVHNGFTSHFFCHTPLKLKPQHHISPNELSKLHDINLKAT